MRHYELIIFYCCGGTPKEAKIRFNVSANTAYRYYRHFREGLHGAGFSYKKKDRKRFTKRVYQFLEKNAPEVVFVPVFVASVKEKEPNRLDASNYE